MNYSARANLANIIFIALIFLGPTGYCLYDTSVPTDIGRRVILLSFALAGFVIMDWYHFYWSHSFGGILGAIAVGASVASASLILAVLFSTSSIAELALFEHLQSWEDLAWLLRFYVSGVGICAAAAVGVARLVVLRSLGEFELGAAPLKSGASLS